MKMPNLPILLTLSNYGKTRLILLEKFSPGLE